MDPQRPDLSSEWHGLPPRPDCRGCAISTVTVVVVVAIILLSCALGYTLGFLLAYGIREGITELFKLPVGMR